MPNSLDFCHNFHFPVHPNFQFQINFISIPSWINKKNKKKVIAGGLILFDFFPNFDSDKNWSFNPWFWIIIYIVIIISFMPIWIGWVVREWKFVAMGAPLQWGEWEKQESWGLGLPSMGIFRSVWKNGTQMLVLNEYERWWAFWSWLALPLGLFIV